MSDRKEYIERGALLKEAESRLVWNHQAAGVAVYEAIQEAPATDVVEVVRCKDCKKRYVPAYCALWYGQINDEHGCRDIFLHAYNDDFYCAYGERKDGAGND